MGTGPLGKRDPGTQPPTCQMGGTEAAAAPESQVPTVESSSRGGCWSRDSPPRVGGSWLGGRTAGWLTSPLSPLRHVAGCRGGRGQTQISNETCVLGSCSIDTEARRAQG